MSNEITELNESSPARNSALDARNRRSCQVRTKDNSNNVMNLPETKWVQIYMNGDEHFSGCRCVVNSRYYRNLDMFLSYLTERLQPSFGAIRQLYTPINGHPVLNLDDLVSKQRYVVAGNERFKKLDFGYSDIGGKRNKRSRLITKSKFKVTKAKPQCHNALVIYLYQNGSFQMKPQKLHFLTIDLENWETVFKKISEVLKWGPIKRICSLNGKPVRMVEDLVNNQSYVMVGKHEVFKVGHYGCIPQKINSGRILYHHPSQKSSVITTRSSGVHSRSSAQSLRVNRSLSSSKSNRETPVSKSVLLKNLDRNMNHLSKNLDEYQYLSAYEDLMLKANSAKSDLATKISLDLDADMGGIFRSKVQNSQTVGAAEIEDGPETLVDLPVDLLEAEEIEDEITPDMERSLQHLSLDVPDEIVAFLPSMQKKNSGNRQVSTNKYNISHSQNLDIRNIFV
ncbi:doublecortin domain-containing protein 2C [Nephila pilipes]|uniref:Doublecortin domain-containing protein 2C n=1 Tax=Nephila pilipes TaxID=299642 RepID=A0A8X6UMD0_NEPPI|nr:doublecortin domain-containing protein 2C [Nephila pilipes]